MLCDPLEAYDSWEPTRKCVTSASGSLKMKNFYSPLALFVRKESNQMNLTKFILFFTSEWLLLLCVICHIDRDGIVGSWMDGFVNYNKPSLKHNNDANNQFLVSIKLVTAVGP